VRDLLRPGPVLLAVRGFGVELPVARPVSGGRSSLGEGRLDGVCCTRRRRRRFA
jgi:hypothetical protein